MQLLRSSVIHILRYTHTHTHTHMHTHRSTYEMHKIRPIVAMNMYGLQKFKVYVWY